VFRLLKLLISVAALGAFVWFGLTVPLGSMTLFQHLQAIGRTRETRDLLDGTRDSAKPLVDGVRRRIGGNTGADSVTIAPDGGAAPAEELSATDRQHLRKLLGSGPSGR